MVCLLYTSDAADDSLRVDLGGRRIIKKGDVNGDGFDDFIIGAYGDEDGGGAYAGQTYLILGRSSGWSMDTDLSLSNASFIGEATFDSSGDSVSGVGDVNGDGFDDFLIGAPFGSSFLGENYLILGRSSGWSMDTDLSMSNASFFGESAGDSSGGSVSGVGDVNGDGFDDFLIGAYSNYEGGMTTGQTYLILGRSGGWSMDTNLSLSNASFIGELIGDSSGDSVSGVGDVNGDGFDDFLIGAYSNDEGGMTTGQTYLILGHSSGWSMDIDLSMSNASFIGENINDSSGDSVSGVGDVNGDGFDDFLIGASFNSQGGVGAGQSYLIFGEVSVIIPQVASQNTSEFPVQGFLSIIFTFLFLFLFFSKKT